MPLWTPTQDWLGQDAFVIGGGSSLQGFAWDKLRGKNTIGCNDAFRLGPEVVKFCLIGDASWFQRNKWDLAKFTGRVVSCAPTLLNIHLGWLLQMERLRDGLQTGSTLGWNYSTGAAAINLAVTLGATRVFLLGFDLNRNLAGQSHWHGHRKQQTADVSFIRFQKGFARLAVALKAGRPDVRVLNVTDGGSALTVFPTQTFAELDEVLK